MKHIIKLFSTVFVAATMTLGSSAAVNYGYCTNTASRSNIFRLGSTELQGMAIRLDHEKVSALKGCTISGVQAVFGSARATAGTPKIFIAASLEGAPLVEQAISIGSATRWQTYTLDKPYVITGDEDCLYIGYTAEISTNATMLHADYTADSEGTSYIYSDGRWVDSYGMGFGNASIRVSIDGPAAFTDLMLKPVSLKGYFRADNEYALDAQVYNFGANEVKAFDVSVSIGDGQAVTMKFDGLSIPQGTCYDIQLPTFHSDNDGQVQMHIEVTGVNGTADTAAADNVYDRAVYFYPAGMERSVLLEGFTGQECHNCPGGHQTIHTFLQTATTTPVIEVMHHAGFSPDFFTMDADMDYTYFFGGTGTYAPAVMVNRAAVPSIGTFPVMGVSTGNLQTAYSAVEATEPYASLGLESTYDPETRQVTVRLHTYAHVDLPSAANLINVVLTQDGIISLQIPYGTNYEHNAVFRGTLTGNSWGILLDPESAKAGGEAEWTTTFTLPEGIFSDYEGYKDYADDVKAVYTIPTDPANMHIVAYIGSYGNTPLDHRVYNAVSVPLGGSHIQGGITGIEEITPDKGADIAIYVDGGRICVSGEYDTVAVYDVNGRAADAQAQLRPGLYVVRVLSGNHATVRKIMVR